jgi:hypothetical protein
MSLKECDSLLPRGIFIAVIATTIKGTYSTKQTIILLALANQNLSRDEPTWESVGQSVSHWDTVIRYGMVRLAYGVFTPTLLETNTPMRHIADMLKLMNADKGDHRGWYASEAMESPADAKKASVLAYHASHPTNIPRDESQLRKS